MSDGIKTTFSRRANASWSLPSENTLNKRVLSSNTCEERLICHSSHHQVGRTAGSVFREIIAAQSWHSKLPHEAAGFLPQGSSPTLWHITQPGRWSFVRGPRRWWDEHTGQKQQHTHKKKKNAARTANSETKKKNEMKDKCAAGCSPVYSWYTGVLLLCLAALLGADRHFKVCTRRLSSIEKHGGDQRTVGPVGAGTLQGRDQLEHLVFTASTHTHTHTHTGFYTHVRWPHGSTHSPPACYIYLLTHEQALIACLSPPECTRATYKHTRGTYTLQSHVTSKIIFEKIEKALRHWTITN